MRRNEAAKCQSTATCESCCWAYKPRRREHRIDADHARDAGRHHARRTGHTVNVHRWLTYTYAKPNVSPV